MPSPSPIITSLLEKARALKLEVADRDTVDTMRRVPAQWDWSAFVQELANLICQQQNMSVKQFKPLFEIVMTLVYSDDDRIERMFDALHRNARDQQIIVFSCRQRAFARLGGNSLGMTDWSPERR